VLIGGPVLVSNQKSVESLFFAVVGSCRLNCLLKVI